MFQMHLLLCQSTWSQIPVLIAGKCLPLDGSACIEGDKPIPGMQCK